MFSLTLGESIPSILATTIVGMAIEGAVDLMQGVIASEIGLAATKSENIKRVGLVTGIVSFFGAVGLAVGRIFALIIFKRNGFKIVFYIFAACNLLAIVVLIKRIVPDVIQFISSIKSKITQQRSMETVEMREEHRF